MPVDEKPELVNSKPQPSATTGGFMGGSASPKKRKAGLAPEIQAQIGARLMAAYDDVLQQPVPDRFRQLLEDLDAKTAKPASGGEPS